MIELLHHDKYAKFHSTRHDFGGKFCDVPLNPKLTASVDRLTENICPYWYSPCKLDVASMFSLYYLQKYIEVRAGYCLFCNSKPYNCIDSDTVKTYNLKQSSRKIGQLLWTPAHSSYQRVPVHALELQVTENKYFYKYL